jgi:phosphatidylglycerol:prolipoprotein diacylglycerol transferase
VLWVVILRIGCFLAGCCWGTVTGSPTGVSFPAGSLAWEQHVALDLIAADADRSLPVHPTQLYEMALLTGWLLILTRLERKIGTPGLLAALTLAGYTLLRFTLEFLRADSSEFIAALSFTQLLCILLLLASAAAGRSLYLQRAHSP